MVSRALLCPLAPPTAAPQAPGMVDGVVHSFKDMNGDALSNWRVTLSRADLAPIGADPSLNEGPRPYCGHR